MAAEFHETAWLDWLQGLQLALATAQRAQARSVHP